MRMCFYYEPGVSVILPGLWWASEDKMVPKLQNNNYIEFSGLERWLSSEEVTLCFLGTQSDSQSPWQLTHNHHHVSSFSRKAELTSPWTASPKPGPVVWVSEGPWNYVFLCPGCSVFLAAIWLCSFSCCWKSSHLWSCNASAHPYCFIIVPFSTGKADPQFISAIPWEWCLYQSVTAV